MDYMFDHTVLVAKNDPHLEGFKTMGEQGVAQIRIVPATGAEKFAEFIYHKLNPFVQVETNRRVRVTQVEFMEHGKNTAIYSE
jgi:6-pyruvoyltetrahydropterin/6-carboxytetrahydropterin synthase